LKLRELVESVASRAGFEVRSANVEPPPGLDWVVDVVAGAPGMQVVVRVAGSDRQEKLVLVMPIGFSETHRSLIMGLEAEKRVRLVTRIIREVLRVCPYCRVGVGGTPVEPQGVVAEIHYVARPDPQRLLDDITRLLSVFLAVNAVLWEEFPSAMQPGSQPPLYT